MEYHFYITRNGRVHTTRRIAKEEAHTKGFNRHSIGVCYKGGLNESGVPTDTRTEWQKISLPDLLTALSHSFP